MVAAQSGSEGAILAVDIGASTIKFGAVSPDGKLLGDVRRLPTPYPCTPSRLVQVVSGEIAASGLKRAGVGFPGELSDGLVIEPGNLSRPGGIATEIDPIVHREWLNFDLRRAFREACTQDVRVVNDATLAALGYCEGRGKELVFTLGTGFGIALVVNGSPKRIRDVGAEEFVDGRTYDELLGEPSRANDEDRWYQLLHSAVSSFADEFGADIVHFGGGNARLLDVGRFADLKCRIVINGYEDTLRGAARLFDR